MMRILLAGVVLLAAPALAQSHLKPYQSWEDPVTFAIPDGWTVMEEGQSVFFAPTADQIMWEAHDYDTQPLYIAGKINPYLTLSDRAADRVRPVKEFAQATMQSLALTEGLAPEGVIESKSLPNAREAVSFLMSTKGRYHYQYIVSLTRNDFIVVSASGPKAKLAEMRAVVDAVARDSRPSK